MYPCWVFSLSSRTGRYPSSRTLAHLFEKKIYILILMECFTCQIRARGIQNLKKKKLITHIATTHHSYRRLLQLIEDIITVTRRIYQ